MLAQSSEIDPRAVELLESATSFLANQSQLSVDTHGTIEVVLHSGQKIQFDHATTLLMQRPNKLRAAARERFWELRDLKPDLEKKPSTAELLTWLSILSARRASETEIRDCRLGDFPALGALIKDATELRRLKG